MYITIVLRKEVADRDAGLAVIQQVKTAVEPYPEVTLTAQITEKIEQE